MIEFVFVPVVLGDELVECPVASGRKDFSCDPGDGLAAVVVKRSIASPNSRIPHLREFKRVFALLLLPELILCTTAARPVTYVLA